MEQQKTDAARALAVAIARAYFRDQTGRGAEALARVTADAIHPLVEALEVAERKAALLLRCQGFNDPNTDDGPAYGPSVHAIHDAVREALAAIRS